MQSENSDDRAQTNSFNNLTMQDARFNQIFWYGLELWTSKYCEEKGFEYFIICNLIILTPKGHRTYKIPKINGFLKPYEMAKICFFVNKDHSFESRSFIMVNDNRCQYWHECEVTLADIEKRFPLLRFLDRNTADPDRFLNKAAQQRETVDDKNRMRNDDPTVSK